MFLLWDGTLMLPVCCLNTLLHLFLHLFLPFSAQDRSDLSVCCCRRRRALCISPSLQSLPPASQDRHSSSTPAQQRQPQQQRRRRHPTPSHTAPVSPPTNAQQLPHT